MVDYSKWDALELSDDSDIEVHPNVDKRSFIRAKQSQIHAERQHRKLQIEALKHERAINAVLWQRLSSLLSALEPHTKDARTWDPAEVAFQAIMQLAPQDSKEDSPPPRPGGVSDADQPLPSYTQMMAGILTKVGEKLDEECPKKEERYEAFIKEIGMHLHNIEQLQGDSTEKLEELAKLDETKITSESYRLGFDSSHIGKAAPDGTLKERGDTELLNPDYDLDQANSSSATGSKVTAASDGDEAQASPTAKEFAHIEASDYRASWQFISSHPEVLRESETDGLLIEAFNLALNQSAKTCTWQYVHQALLLQYCRLLSRESRDGVAMFFKGVATPGHRAREAFEKDVAERFQRIEKFASENVKESADKGEDVEQIQIQPIEEGTTIQVRIPQAQSEDDAERKARTTFEGFAPDMRAALESGSLDEVNKVLGTMAVAEAEEMVNLLGDAGCLSIEDEVIDATKEEGKKRLRDIKEAAKSEEGRMTEEHVGDPE